MFFRKEKTNTNRNLSLRGPCRRFFKRKIPMANICCKAALSVFFPSPGEGLPFCVVTASETLSNITNCSKNLEIFESSLSVC